MLTAARTVLFSAVTVAAAMACLTVFPQRFLISMGLGGIVVALVAGAATVILLPALLMSPRSRLGRHRARSPSILREIAWRLVHRTGR